MSAIVYRFGGAAPTLPVPQREGAMAERTIDDRVEAAAQAFGNLVRRHREDCGISQAALARIVGVSRGFIIDLERGKATTQLGLALVIADAVGIRTASLLAGGEAPETASPSEADDDLPEMEDPDAGSPRVL
jgi:HTH-type transcriptional regulator/antitoxin HipB